MLLSFCGLDCEKCDALIATKNNDNVLRVKMAEKWSKSSGANIKPEDINCVGCTQKGVRVYFCESMCEVRKCASARNYQNCAVCPDYACDKLKQIFDL